METRNSFNDKLVFPDEESFQRLGFKRTPADEEAADTKALDLLKNSPYKDKLANAGLFLKALADRSNDLPNLLNAHMGNPMADGKNVKRMKDLMGSAPELEKTKVEEIAALPLGGRVRVDEWTNQLELIKTKPVALMSAREKMPFEVAPVFLYLTRQKDGATVASKNNN